METKDVEKRISDLETKFKEDLANLRSELAKGKGKKSDNIQDRIMTYEDACEEIGVTPEEDLPYQIPKNDKQVALNAIAKLATIVKAFNKGWEPNWDDPSEWKYYPWFDVSSSGLGFADSRTHCANACTSVGSRLCFKTKTDAVCVGWRFFKIYEEWLLIKK